MRKTLLFISMVVFALATTIVRAKPAAAGLFIGGNLGYASVSTPDIAVTTRDQFGNFLTITQKDSHFAWNLNTGVNYKVSPNTLLGFELGYTSYGYTQYDFSSNFRSKSIELSTSAWDLLFTGAYVFNNGINLFAKVGSAYEIAKLESKSNFAVRPEIVAGVGYMVDDVNFTAEYRHIFADNSNDDNSSSSGVLTVNALMVGIKYCIPI